MSLADHQGAVQQAEMIRQVALAKAQNSAAEFSLIGDLQSATNAIQITYFRACLASATANEISPVPYMTALRDLGTGGT
jgi:hypothetical protein